MAGREWLGPSGPHPRGLSGDPFCSEAAPPPVPFLASLPVAFVQVRASPSGWLSARLVRACQSCQCKYRGVWVDLPVNTVVWWMAVAQTPPRVALGEHWVLPDFQGC